MWSILERLENQLALPGDSDTRRKQKVAALLAGVAGMAVAFFTAAVFSWGGAPAVMWLQIALGVFMLVPIVWLLLRPRDYTFLVVFTAVIVTIHPWVANFFSGGFRSGTMQAFWTVFGPFSAILLVGLGPSLGCGLVLVVCAVTGTYLEPLAVQMSPALLPQATRFLALFNVITLSAMIIVPTVYLFRELQQAREQTDALLLNILPEPVAAQLKQGVMTIADSHAEVTVLFADIVSFTQISAGIDPSQVVGLLNEIFSAFDDLADSYGLEKIKTVGDAYMVAGGLPLPRPDHCEAVTAFGLDLLATIKSYHAWNGDPITVRVGIHSGPVVAGVIGHRKFSYDLWGDTVNTASRMESNGLASVIQVTAEVRDKLHDLYIFEERPPIFVKGKGLMTTYLLTGPV